MDCGLINLADYFNNAGGGGPVVIVTLRFVNNSNGTVRLYFVSSGGSAWPYLAFSAGTTKEQQSTLGMMWIARREDNSHPMRMNGNCFVKASKTYDNVPLSVTD